MWKKLARADQRVPAIGAVVVLTQQLQSCDRVRGIVSFVRLALKFIMQNDRECGCNPAITALTPSVCLCFLLTLMLNCWRWREILFFQVLIRTFPQFICFPQFLLFTCAEQHIWNYLTPKKSLQIIVSNNYSIFWRRNVNFRNASVIFALARYFHT